MIIKVDEKTLLLAAEIHSVSWKSSHKDICNEAFTEKHTVENQREYLRREIQSGKVLYLLIEEKPVGIVSVNDNMIENLYVLPSEQNKGYGTKLLLFALEQCHQTPCLWVLENNRKAYSLYAKYGFRVTGNRHQLSETLAEIEMKQGRLPDQNSQ